MCCFNGFSIRVGVDILGRKAVSGTHFLEDLPCREHKSMRLVVGSKVHLPGTLAEMRLIAQLTTF